MYIYIYVAISIYVYIYTENETMEKGKQKFVFLGQQTINGNQRLLFQKMCPSMHNTQPIHGLVVLC